MELIQRLAFGLIGLAILASRPAHAQTTYSNTVGEPVNENVASCAAPLRKPIVVGDTGNVGDVEIGLLITHTYRGDLVTYLESPIGTRVQLTTNNGGAGGDNLNVEFDDAAPTAYTSASTSAAHSTTAPPYEYSLSPLGTLDTFTGEAMNGTWIVEICDFYNQDSGNFVRADLTLLPAPPTADLSLSVSETVSNPATGANTTLTFTVSNAGPDAADGIQVEALLPAGLSYVSDTGGGAYNAGTGIWTVPGTLASGASINLQVTASANASGSGAVVAEIISATQVDSDSTPNNRNGAPLEDDTAYTTIVINGPPPGTPPTLSCPVSTSTFDWNNQSWTAGSLSQSYATGVGFNFTVTGDTGFFQNNAAFGGQNPALSTTLEGGLGGAEQSLHLVVNFTSSSQQVGMTIDVGTPGEGVDNLQFRIFDLDINPNTAQNAHFLDRVRVFGYLNGAAKGAILTPGAANTVSGSTATGTASAASNSADGNLVVTFNSPVDQVVFYYDNDPAVASNPGQQGISLHDIEYCPRGSDFSDAPASYGTPSHYITDGYRLGLTAPDRDTAAMPTVNADGDDISGSDDEDGVSFPALSQGQNTTLSVPVTGAGGFLRLWVDWNGDGVFQTGELVADDLQTFGSTISVPVSVPVNAATTQTIARLRWSTQSGLSFDGTAPDGEVEDYPLTVAANASASCPAGYILASQAGTADAVIVDAQNGTLALGTPEAAGTGADTSNSARVSNTSSTLTLDLTDLVAQNASLLVHGARDTNSGEVDVRVSDDGVSYSSVATLNSGSTDVIQQYTVLMPTGGARYVQFQRNGGRFWIAGMSYGEICLPPAVLNGSKSTIVYDPAAEGLFAIPGNDVVYTITVSNSGDGVADDGSVILIDAVPANLEVFNGTTPEFGGNIIGWSESGSGLSFDPVTDLGFSNAATKPADMSECSYVPAAGYDPAITFICFNPKGVFAAGDPDPEFSVSFRGRIK